MEESQKETIRILCRIVLYLIQLLVGLKRVTSAGPFGVKDGEPNAQPPPQVP